MVLTRSVAIVCLIFMLWLWVRDHVSNFQDCLDVLSRCVLNTEDYYSWSAVWTNDAEYWASLFKINYDMKVAVNRSSLHDYTAG